MPSEAVWLTATIAREYHIAPDEILWRWPLSRCWLFIHHYQWSKGVTCAPRMHIEEQLAALARA